MVDGAKPVNPGTASKDERIEKKMEDKSAESAKADVSAEDGNPGAEDRTPSNKTTGPVAGREVGPVADGKVVDTGALKAAEESEKAAEKEREKLKVENEKKAVEAEKQHKIETAEKIKAGVTGTFQRADGTIGSTDNPDRTATYIAGKRVLITKAEKDKYDALNEEMNKLQDNRLISEIALNDPFWQKKSELDSFITGLRS